MKESNDRFTVDLESELFENDGEHFFISRVYASFEKPKPDTDDIKLREVKEGSFSGYVPSKASIDLDAFGQKFFYSPTWRITGPLFEKKRKELKFVDIEKYSIDRNIDELNEYRDLSEKEKFEKYPPEGLGFWYDYTKFDDEEEERKRKILEDYTSSISPKYLIRDEIRFEINPKNLDTYLTVSKKRLEKLNRHQIASWYSYEKSESVTADTEQKKQTAIRKRRTDILKFLPVDKPIKDLIGSSAFKEGKKDLSTRIKRKQELDRGPKIPMKIDYFSIIGWGVILLIIFWFALGDLDGPKSDCEKAFEYHKDYQVLDQCRRNTIIKDMYDN